MMATASRLWRSSPGPAVGRVRPGLRFSVSTSVISNPCACLSRCCTRDRRQGGLRDLPSSNWETCCCSAVSSRASATAGLERVSTLAPSWEARASACSSSGSVAPAVDVHHQPGQLPALGEAVAVTHQGGAVLIPDADHQFAPQRQGGLASRLPLQLQIPSTWLAAVCIASSRRAVRLLREKKDCRAALAWWGT